MCKFIHMYNLSMLYIYTYMLRCIYFRDVYVTLCRGVSFFELPPLSLTSWLVSLCHGSVHVAGASVRRLHLMCIQLLVQSVLFVLC